MKARKSFIPNDLQGVLKQDYINTTFRSLENTPAEFDENLDNISSKRS